MKIHLPAIVLSTFALFLAGVSGCGPVDDETVVPPEEGQELEMPGEDELTEPWDM